MTSPDPTDPGLSLIERKPHLRIVIPLIVAAGFFMENLDSTIITTAIPVMAEGLKVTPLQLNLAITTYVLTLAVFIPVSGWVADRFGARKIFPLALLVFTAGSMACGLANSLEMLVATRALQGLGGAMMTPVGRLILLRSFPRHQLVQAMTWMTLPAIVGPLIGPLLGGFLATYASWRWAFYINVPFGLVGAYLAWRYVEDTPVEKNRPFDIRGFLLFGAGLALLQAALEMLRDRSSPVVLLGVFVGAALLFAAFAVHARRVAHPVVDFGLFRDRAFRLSNLAGGMSRIALNGVPFLLPLMLQLGFGFSAVASGGLTFLSALAAIGLRTVSTRMLRTFGFNRVLMGSGVAASVMIASFALMEADTPMWLMALMVFGFGLARSTQFLSANTLSYSSLPAEKLSSATSMGGVMQQLGVSVGVSVAAMLVGLFAGEGGTLTVPDFHKAFLVMALMPLLAAIGYTRLRPEDGASVSGHVRKVKPPSNPV